jgi:RimJ/RimL family protein N-acetyltransferase
LHSVSQIKILKNKTKAPEMTFFFSLFFGDVIAGFYCLRGFDNNFEVPSFGVYVSSKFQGRGFATLALINAIDWCKQNSVRRVMLKVEESNIGALSIYKKHKFKFARYCIETGHMVFERKIY